MTGRLGTVQYSTYMQIPVIQYSNEHIHIYIQYRRRLFTYLLTYDHEIILLLLGFRSGRNLGLA